MGNFNADNYVDVHARIQEFYAKYPDGRLVTERWEVVEVNGRSFVVTESLAYRTVDDPLPAKGLAWEPVPGGTPFTRDSELMNSETSSWGRAIVALGGFDTKIASADEVRNRQYDERPPQTTRPSQDNNLPKPDTNLPKVPNVSVPALQRALRDRGGLPMAALAPVLNVPESSLQKGLDLMKAAQAWAMERGIAGDVEDALMRAFDERNTDAA